MSASPPAASPTTPATTLRGSLADIPIEGVLGMLHQRHRSGLLVVNPTHPWWLIFVDGNLFLGGGSSSMMLGRSLLASGAISAEQLEQLFGLVQNRLGERVNRTLDDAEVLATLAETVSHDDLQAAVRSHLVGAAFEMMQCGDAEFVFTEAAAHEMAGQFQSSTPDIVAAAADHITRWPDVCARIGGDSMRLKRVRRIGRDDAPVMLDAVEWAAISEIDDRSTVGQIAHRLGRGRFETYSLLLDLLDRGLVELAG